MSSTNQTETTTMTTTNATTYTRFVAVGNDGFRPVIWGIGDTEAEAISDALAQDGGPTDATFLFTHPCTPAIEERFQLGDVSWVRSGEPQEV